MDIVEVIKQRKSIRAFKPTPVPQEVLSRIAELALRAPSWANTQPWELAIVSGAKLEAIKEAFSTQHGARALPDFPGPEEFPEAYKNRFQNLAAKMSEAAKKGRRGKKAGEWYLQGPRLYGAPAAIYILIDRSFFEQRVGLNVYPVFDCGLLAQNIMLLATDHGLGTIIQAQAVHYPNVLRRMLGLPDSKLVLVGIAIGYPDWEDPINEFRSDREPVDSLVKWYGFD
ncbi:MAG: nitroreductase [Dehalococcoidia bacterium]|nr:nitroreductase [Dehalococcoidia bacterium]